MSRAQNREFQEWWNKQREFLDNSSDDNHRNSPFLTVDIRTSSSSSDPSAVLDKGRTRSARQLSWLWILKFQQLAASLSWLTSASISLLLTANRRIASPDSRADSSSSRLYRAIKLFLFLVILLLCFELAAYFKGWHFSQPSVESAEAVVERVYANWLEIRPKYLAPPLQILTDVCIVLFLIQSVDRVVLMLRCFWIKIKKLKPVASLDYGSLEPSPENVEDCPMVLVQIPMCNDLDAKRSKPNEGIGNENSPVTGEEGAMGNGNDKQFKSNSKPPEPPKDYSHFRARRGQAIDSHSLAERVRREKISERMKLLQDLVPGCNKVAGKALMLDEIINYVQSLQRQVEFLSMKLASINTSLDVNMDTLVSKDIYQSSEVVPQRMFPLDSSASAFFGPQPQHNPGVLNNISNRTVSQTLVDLLDMGLCQNFNMPLPPLDEFDQSAPQFSKGKAKHLASNPPANASKDDENNDDLDAKRTKLNEGIGNENSPVTGEEEAMGNGNDKQFKSNSKPPEPPKDYIHVRARRGQATDSHSLAERVRREKISERMKLLQDLVPGGCNKVTGKALMLDEIINYVQSLQRQVEFLSMKFASVNTCLDFNMDTLVSKDVSYFLSSQLSN